MEYDIWHDDVDGTVVKFKFAPAKSLRHELWSMGMRYDDKRFLWREGTMSEAELRELIEDWMQYAPSPYGNDKGTGMW